MLLEWGCRVFAPRLRESLLRPLRRWEAEGPEGNPRVA